VLEERSGEHFLGGMAAFGRTCGNPVEFNVDADISLDKVKLAGCRGAQS